MPIHQARHPGQRYACASVCLLSSVPLCGRDILETFQSNRRKRKLSAGDASAVSVAFSDFEGMWSIVCRLINGFVGTRRPGLMKKVHKETRAAHPGAQELNERVDRVIRDLTAIC